MKKRSAYKIATSLPAKLFFAGEALISLATVAWPDQVKEWVEWAMTPEQTRLIGLAGLVIGLAYVALLLWLKSDDEPDTDVGIRADRGSMAAGRDITTSMGDSFHLSHSGIGDVIGKMEVPKLPPRQFGDPLFQQFKDFVLEHTTPEWSVEILSKPGDDEAMSFGNQIWHYFKERGHESVGHDLAMFAGPFTGLEAKFNKTGKALEIKVGSDDRA